jgi:hypothetical protein
MPQTNSNSPGPVSPELKRLQQPGQNSIRTALRIAGPLTLLTGIICVIIAAKELVTSGMEPPRHFWLAFIGIPLMFFGAVLCQFGFMGAVARFMAGESAPVAADTVNFMAGETKGAVESVAKAAAKGVVEGIEAGRSESGANHAASGSPKERS